MNMITETKEELKYLLDEQLTLLSEKSNRKDISMSDMFNLTRAMNETIEMRLKLQVNNETLKEKNLLIFNSVEAIGTLAEITAFAFRGFETNGAHDEAIDNARQAKKELEKIL